ncbi:MAG TPA: hypothetical protein VGH34_23685 [Vicinamibacterales bacterium]
MPARFGMAAAMAVTVSTLVAVYPAARQQQPYPKTSAIVPYKPATGRCLTAEQRKANDAYNALDRPTRPGDEMMFWDPEYFVGLWNVDMRVQDSPLGQGGQSVGTLTIKSNDRNGCLYEGTMKGEDPEGKPFTRTISATYDPIKKILAWSEKDSRGYTIARTGPVGGELGGTFHHHFGDDPSPSVTTFGGRKIRFKGVTEMSSPAYYKTDMQLSIDGAPFVTYGRVLLEKVFEP